MKDGAILLSNGKFNYDIKLPSPARFPGGFNTVSKDYPLVEIKILKKKGEVAKMASTKTQTQQEVEDEKGELASELDSLKIK